jgi:hypothetical protein
MKTRQMFGGRSVPVAAALALFCCTSITNGTFALYKNTSGSGNIAIGGDALDLVARLKPSWMSSAEIADCPDPLIQQPRSTRNEANPDSQRSINSRFRNEGHCR